MTRMRPAFSWVLYAIFLLAAACKPPSGDDRADLRAAFEAADFAHEASDIPADPGVRYGVLENGMRYAIMENATPGGTAVMRLVLNAGSLAESESQRGLAHFVEHMAFNGTTNVPEGEMVPLLERYGLAFGPDTNAFTSREAAGYLLNLPSVSEEVINAGLFLLRETASEITFSPDAIDRERGVILGEERARNTPVSRFFNAYNRFLFPGTLVPERDPIGLVEVIENAPREEFIAYYRDFYVPRRALLVVAGDIDADEIEAKIRDGFELDLPGVELDRAEGFSSWEQPAEAAPDPDPGTLERITAPRFGFFHDPDVFNLIMVDVLSPGPGDLDTRAARHRDLLRMLGGQIVQRRIQSAINRGGAPLVQANFSFTNSFGLADKAGAFAVTSPDRWREGVAMVEQELRRALEHGFTRAELDEQMANLRTQLRNGVDQANTRPSPNLADSIWSNWLNDSVFSHPAFGLSLFESLEAQITTQAVEAAFREIWQAAPPHVFVGLNEPLEGGEAAVREAWLASTAEPVEARLDADSADFAYEDFGPPGAIVQSESIDDLGVHRFVFENGVRLNVKQTDFEDNIIRVRVDFGAGQLTPQPVPAAGSILGAAFRGAGLEAHDSDDLDRLLAGRSAGYGLGVGEDSFFFANATTPTDFELQMQVFTAFMTAPGWREDGLSQFRSIADEIRRGQNSQTVQVAATRVARMLRGGDARWGFPTREEVDAFTMDHAREMLEPALERAPVEITIVGDVAPERAAHVVAETFGALPERSAVWPDYPENRAVPFPEPVNEPLVVRFNGQLYQGMANVYFPTDDGSDARRRRALNLMAAIYRLKAIERFREREGATYSPIVSGQASTVFDDFGYLWVGLDVARDEVDRMYPIIEEIARDMASGEINEDELQRARQPILESLSQNLERNAYWLSALSRSQSRPERLDDIRTARDHYLDMTVEEITAMAARYLRPENAWRVSILPHEDE